MCDLSMESLLKKDPVLPRVAAAEEVLWLNPGLQSAETALPPMELGMADILDAEARLQRFAPFIRERFPETVPRGGLIESPLTPIPRMQRLLEERFGAVIPGRLLLKQDSHLAIAGSVKARGGIYEVLKHTEELAMENGLLSETDDYAKLASPEMREFFSRYTVQVGSTGNLGLSIGIASAAVGYKVIVHMSVDAKQWKKDLLRANGVQVIEYEADYGEAVKQGRARSDADPMSRAAAAAAAGRAERCRGPGASAAGNHSLRRGRRPRRRGLRPEARVRRQRPLLLCRAHPGPLYAGGHGHRPAQQGMRAGSGAYRPYRGRRPGGGAALRLCGRRDGAAAVRRGHHRGPQAVYLYAGAAGE